MWCSNQQPLHCAFTLERCSGAATQLSCNISVRQVKGHEQILQVNTTVAEVSASAAALFSLFLSPHTYCHRLLSFTWKESPPFLMRQQSDCRTAVAAVQQTDATPLKIPPSIRQRICATFDLAEDWQLLARMLHLDR